MGTGCRVAARVAASHYMPFLHTLITALITAGWTAHLGIFCNSLSAISHFTHFSKAPLAGSQLVWFSCNAVLGITCSNPRTDSHYTLC